MPEKVHRGLAGLGMSGVVLMARVALAGARDNGIGVTHHSCRSSLCKTGRPSQGALRISPSGCKCPQVV